MAVPLVFSPSFNSIVYLLLLIVKLGMSPSTLNRWISIGNSKFIMDHQKELPSTFSSYASSSSARWDASVLPTLLS